MNFADKVLAIVQKIPHGRVASYSMVASLAGSPRSARAVGRILRTLPGDTKVPWQRVISISGRLSILNFNIPASFQAELLKAEGIEFQEKNSQFYLKDKQLFWEG